MKLTFSFVIALAAASSASSSPLFRRQNQISSAGGGLPSSSAISSVLAGPFDPATASSSSSATRVSSAAATTFSPSPTGGILPPTGTGTTFNDTQILQYALTLEHLEAEFYNQSLSKLSTSDFENAGYNASVRNQIYSIGRDEASHVSLLTEALGDQAVPACTYNFSAVTDVASFLTTARVLEGVGVSAYLGAAQNISNSSVLETAGSILVVEGQHQTYLIAQTNEGGNVIPGAFSTALDFKQVYSLAAPFIESCPENASLPITAFPTLSLSGGENNGSFTPGQQVTASYTSTNSTSSSSTDSNGTYLAIIQGVGAPQFLALDSNSSQVTLPSNLTGGQMYAVVTSSNTSVTDDTTIAGPALGYVYIPLVEAPEATNAAPSSTVSSASGSSAATSTGAVGAGPTGTPTDSSAASSATASGSDSIVSTDSLAAASASAVTSAATGASSATQGIPASIASLGSANLPQPTGAN